jgi:hypothetical protein
MTVKKVELSVAVPYALWEQLHWQAQTSKEEETTLLVRALTQFLQQEANKVALVERLQQECEELATLDFHDAGTEDEWLIIQNEALNKTEVDWA